MMTELSLVKLYCVVLMLLLLNKRGIPSRTNDQILDILNIFKHLIKKTIYVDRRSLFLKVRSSTRTQLKK